MNDGYSLYSFSSYKFTDILLFSDVIFTLSALFSNYFHASMLPFIGQ